MSTFPFLQLREFGDDGKLLGGGRIWFYEQGTTTPKTTWQDVAHTIPNTNPVQLSASGSAKIECSGAYSYKIERYASGGYILQDEGSFTAGDGDGNGGGSVTVYENYDALEVATSGDAVAIVQDGYNQGDRAGGMFLRDDAIPQTLTDGVSVIGVHKYRRVYNGPIAATWCGVVDNGLAQAVQVTRALNASITYGRPVAFDETIQIESTIQVQAGTAVILGDQCRLSGSIVVNWNFAVGSQLVSCAPGVFGPNVRPRFDTGVFEFLRLSWCKGATDDETLIQFLLMPNVEAYTLVVDKSLDDVRTDFTPPGKTNIRFEGGRIRFTTGSRSIAINAWETPPTRQVFEFTFAPVIGSITLPEPARPEWFGAVGNGSDDDTLPVRAAIRSHRVKLRSVYKVTSWGADSWVEFYGDMVQGVAGTTTTQAGLLVAVDPIVFTNFSAENCVFKAFDGDTIISCTYANVYNSTFLGSSSAAIVVSTSGCFTNCIFDKLADVSAAVPNAVRFITCRFTAELMTLSKTTKIDTNNQHFSDIPNAGILGTTGTGRVFGVGSASTDAIDVSAATIKMNTAEAATSKATRQINPILYVAPGATLPGTHSIVKIRGITGSDVTLPSWTGIEGLTMRIIGYHMANYLTVFGDFVDGATSYTVERTGSLMTSATAVVIATSSGWELF